MRAPQWRTGSLDERSLASALVRIVADVDPAAQFLSVSATIGAHFVEACEHQPRAGDIATRDLQFTIVFKRANVLGVDRQSLLVIALGPVVVALLAPGEALVGQYVRKRTERRSRNGQRRQGLVIAPFVDQADGLHIGCVAAAGATEQHRASKAGAWLRRSAGRS